MTEPMVPKQLEKPTNTIYGWAIVTEYGRFLFFDKYEQLVFAPHDREQESEGWTHLNSEAAQTAAQQHFNELVAECCEVKRCVWKPSAEMPSYYLRECLTEPPLVVADKVGPYCPYCGGLIEVEGGE